MPHDRHPQKLSSAYQFFVYAIRIYNIQYNLSFLKSMDDFANGGQMDMGDMGGLDGFDTNNPNSANGFDAGGMGNDQLPTLSLTPFS